MIIHNIISQQKLYVIFIQVSEDRILLYVPLRENSGCQQWLEEQCLHENGDR